MTDLKIDIIPVETYIKVGHQQPVRFEIVKASQVLRETEIDDTEN